MTHTHTNALYTSIQFKYVAPPGTPQKMFPSPSDWSAKSVSPILKTFLVTPNLFKTRGCVLYKISWLSPGFSL